MNGLKLDDAEQEMKKIEEKQEIELSEVNQEINFEITNKKLILLEKKGLKLILKNIEDNNNSVLN